MDDLPASLPKGPGPPPPATSPPRRPPDPPFRSIPPLAGALHRAKSAAASSSSPAPLFESIAGQTGRANWVGTVARRNGMAQAQHGPG